MKNQNISKCEENLISGSPITEEDKKYAPLLKRKIIATFIKYEQINIKGMTATEINIELIKLIEDVEFRLVIDYKDSLLKEARLHRKSGKSNISCLLYATWFEHWINEIISILCHRKGLSEDEINELVRNVSFRGKFTWLLKIFNFKQINKSHLNIIFRLTELRNNFVHYKWKEKSKNLEKEEILVLNEIEKAVKYLKNLENRYIYNNSKRKLSNL